MARIIDGRKLALEHQLKLKKSKKVKVVSILVGSDKASLMYSKMKQKKALELGINFEIKKFSGKDQFKKIYEYLIYLNQEPSVSGIMVQLPLPQKFSKRTLKLTNKISVKKDIDGLNPKSKFLPATVRAVLSILKNEKISINRKRVVVVGRSPWLGTPLMKQIKKLGGKVEIIHSKTEDPEVLASKADILISCVGKNNLVKENWVKQGAVVIDVGGDIDFDRVFLKASAITPTPGGVGPMTVISLMENILG